jgi:hypothetical protein
VILENKDLHTFSLFKFNIIEIHQLDMESLAYFKKLSLVVAFRKNLNKEQILILPNTLGQGNSNF